LTGEKRYIIYTSGEYKTSMHLLFQSREKQQYIDISLAKKFFCDIIKQRGISAIITPGRKK